MKNPRDLNQEATENSKIDFQEIKLSIEKRLTEKINGSRPDIGRILIEDIADWGIWMRDVDNHHGTRDWFVRFARWALLGRCKEFMVYCGQSGHPRAPEAIKAVEKVYNFHWPHNATCGYVFYAMWGWLQLELEKPGESKPLSHQEQKKLIAEALEKEGIIVQDWIYDACGGVQAVLRKEDVPRFEKLKREQKGNSPRVIEQ